MLTSIEIENFQSLRKLSIGLGKFTVVTGPTGSGKSAVIRAARLLAFNARGISYITRGEKFCKVGMGSQEQGWAAGIERHQARGGDCYRLQRMVPVPAGGYGMSGGKFTKLGGEVPPQVSDLLELSELNFAAQFDRPFLLDASGGEIARVLGRLTNVTLLFDAAREANRRRLEVMGGLKRAEAHLAALAGAAQRFRGMKDRHAAVSEAEEAMEAANQLTVRVGRLQVLTGRLEAAQAALKAAAPPEVPSVERLDELAGQLARARELVAGEQQAREEAVRQHHFAEVARAREQDAHERLHEVLAEAGQCPTCGQAVA